MLNLSPEKSVSCLLAVVFGPTVGSTLRRRNNELHNTERDCPAAYTGERDMYLCEKGSPVPNSV